MERRGQLTIFVIMAIVVVVVATSSILFLNKGESDNSKNVEFARENVEDCLKGVYDDSLNKIALQGGVYNSSIVLSTDSGKGLIFYYFEGQIVNFINVDIVSIGLSLMVDDTVSLCFAESYDGAVTYDYVGTSAVIEDGVVDFTSDLVVTVNKGGSSKNIDFNDIKISVDSELKEMVEVANFIMLDLEANNESLCVTCLNEFVSDKSVSVEVIDYLPNDHILLYTISVEDDTRSPIHFMFLNKFNWDSLYEGPYSAK